jgi:photosystem II stability/assembly factor-like uncharacterized protein
MKQFLALIIVIVASMFMAGCRGSGSSAPAPTNVKVVVGDTSATISWDMLPGVDYWVFKAAGADVTPLSCYGMPQCQMITHAVSPLLVTGLANGTLYSLTVNGRIDGGAGGQGSPSIQATPRLAGATWTVGNALGAYDLHGIAHSSIFVAAGTQGTLLTSADGLAWTPQPAITWLSATPTPLPNFYAITYGGTYVTVGSGGVLLTSTDAVNWAQGINGNSNDLYSVTTNGAGEYVAVGFSGTIINNYGGTWTSATSTPSSKPTLYGVAYGNGRYVAVGAGGTVLTSDAYGTTWATAAASSSLPANDLKGVAYAPVVGSNGTGTFVAVGANGTVVTSMDGGATWGIPTSSSPIPPTVQINAVAYGSQFVAVANDGSIYNSTDGANWTQAASPTTSPLYAVVHGLYDYSAVGAAGLNMHSM